MKKIVLFISLPLLILVAAALAPYWVSSKVEEHFQVRAKNLQLQLLKQHGVSFEVVRYQRGYLASIADTRFTFDPQAAALLSTSSPSLIMQPVSVVLRHQISHGPWINYQFSQETMSKVVTTVVPGDEQQTTLGFYFGDQAALEMTTWLEWSGVIKSEGSMPAYSGRDHTGQYDFQWGGLHFEFEGDWIAMRGKGRFNTPRFELSNAAHGVTVGGFSGDFSSFISPQGLLLGDGEFLLNIFKVRAESRNGEPQEVVLRDAKIAYSAFQREQVVDVMQQFGFRLLQVNEQWFRNGALHLELSSIDVIALQSMQQRYEQMTKTELADTELLQQVWFQEMQRLLPKLLEQAPVIHISKAEVITAAGMMNARLKLAINDGLPISASIELPAGLVALLPLIEIELDIKLPESIIEQQARKVVREKIVEQLQETEQTMTPEVLVQQTKRAAEQMLAQFEIQNILRRESGSFRIALRYHNGRLHLNGVPADNFLNMLPPLKES